MLKEILMRYRDVRERRSNKPIHKIINDNVTESSKEEVTRIIKIIEDDRELLKEIDKKLKEAISLFDKRHK
jgi:hypothetical protein